MAKRSLFAALLIGAAFAVGGGNAAFAAPQPRIVGGTVVPAPSTDWSFTVALLDADGYVLCGGTQIKPSWILTAAHCSEPGDPVAYALLGAKQLSDENQGSIVAIDNAITHPGWDSSTDANDLMLLHLESPYGNGTGLPALSEPSQDPPDGASVRVAGWGDTSFGSGLGSDDLREATVEIQSNAQCAAAYAGLVPSVEIFPTQLCAAHFDGVDSRDTCQGDSGGPLIYESAGAKRVAGITVGGEGCAQSPYAGIYTRVSSYVDWINAKAGKFAHFTTELFDLGLAVPGGVEAADFVGLTNTGGSTLHISGATVSGTGFYLVGSLCGTNDLAPGQTCFIRVGFTPASIGQAHGTLTVASDADSGPVSVPLIAQGLAPAASTLRLLTKPRAFATGKTYKFGKKLKNLGVIATAKIEWTGTGIFRIDANACGQSTSAKLKVRGIKGTIKGRGAVMSPPGIGCVASIAFPIPKKARGRKATVTVETSGNAYVAPASLSAPIRIR